MLLKMNKGSMQADSRHDLKQAQAHDVKLNSLNYSQKDEDVKFNPRLDVIVLHKFTGKQLRVWVAAQITFLKTILIILLPIWENAIEEEPVNHHLVWNIKENRIGIQGNQPAAREKHASMGTTGEIGKVLGR